MQIKMAIIKHLPDIVRESVKPLENIDGIKIVQFDGLNGKDHSGIANDGHHSLADQVVNSALKYRSQAPLIDSLMAEIGMKAGDINGLTEQIKGNGKLPEKIES